MGDATSGDGGNDDPDRAWRRPAPGDPEPPAASGRSELSSTGAAIDPERAVWGPEADVDRPATGRSDPPPPVPSWGPPPEPAGHGGAVPDSEPRWDRAGGPPVGGAGGSRWSGPPGALGVGTDVGIDEHPPRPARRPAGVAAGRWWAHGGIAAAVLAAILIVVAVASGSGDGDDASTASPAPTTTGAPPTTARRAVTTTTAPAPSTSATTAAPGAGEPDPADLAPEDDPRVMLTDLPDGFASVGARLLPKHAQGGMTSGLLFVGDGATWADGPWIRAVDATGASFIGPVTPTDVGGRPGRAGRGMYGTELIVVDGDADAATVAVEAQGVPAGTALTTAAAIVVGPNGSWSLPAAAVPPGLRLATGDLADSLTVRATSAALVNYRGPGGVGVSVYASLADPGYDPMQVAPFFLADLGYVTIGNERGVMGTYRYAGGSTARSVQWRHGGIDIEVTAVGIEVPELLALARSAATRADAGWTERDWAQAEGAAGPMDDSVVVERALQFGDEGGGTLTARRAGTVVSWWVDSPTGPGIGRYGTEAAPLLLQVATNDVPASDTGGGAHIVAVALGDASIDGATLRLRTGTLLTGAEGTLWESGATVHPIGGDTALSPGDGTAGLGYTHGVAIAEPWTEGEFVADLVAADGVTILATATPADLR